MIKHRGDRRSEMLSAVSGVIQGHFPEVSAAVAQKLSEGIADATGDWPYLYHQGAQDRDALKEYANLLQRVRFARSSLSPWAQGEIENVLVWSSRNPHDSDLAQKIDELADRVRRAALEAPRGLDPKYVEGQTNWRAAAVAPAIRDCWAALKRKEAPREWNGATAFGKFFSDVWEALEIEGEPGSAFKAWRKNVYSRG